MADDAYQRGARKLRLHTPSSAWSSPPSEFLVRNASDSVESLTRSNPDGRALASSSSCTKLDEVGMREGTEDVLEGEVVDLSQSRFQRLDGSTFSHCSAIESEDETATSTVPDDISPSLGQTPAREGRRRRSLLAQISTNAAAPARQSSRRNRRLDRSKIESSTPTASSAQPSGAALVSCDAPAALAIPATDPTLHRGLVMSSAQTTLDSHGMFPSLTDSTGSISSPMSIRLQRAQTSAADTSLPRAARRSSARSASSSLTSPAGMFLSQWSKIADDAAGAAQPDDEGQVLGDQREYVIGKQIGFGGFSVVKEVTTIQAGRKIRRAVKIVHKHVEGKDEQENERLQHEFEHEVSIWRHLSHPNILPLLSVFDSPYATFCITPLNTGGTLFDLVRAHRRPSVTASQTISASLENTLAKTDGTTNRLVPLPLVKRYMLQLASAVRYLHQDALMVHRDIKLENCLIDVSLAPDAAQELPVGNLMLCDFGLADFIPLDARNNSHLGEREWSDGIGGGGERSPRQRPLEGNAGIAGSLPYTSPETLAAHQSLYAPCSDIWSYGVLCYALLTTELPFNHAFAPRLRVLIERGEWNVAAVQQALSAHGVEERRVDAAIEVLSQCLNLDPYERWDITQVAECAFLNS